MRLIARIDTKMEYVIKGRQLEGVQKQYKLLDAFETIKSLDLSKSIKPNEFLYTTLWHLFINGKITI